MPRPKIADEIIDEIQDLRAQGKTIDKILEALGDSVARGTVAKYTKQYDQMSEGERKKDDPWNLGIHHPDIPPDATGDLLAVLKLSVALGRKFTVRQAIWASKLRSALQGEPPGLLLLWSTLYERRDRTVARAGRELDTTVLDAELSHQVWKSSLHEWEYDQAVLTGAIPSHLPVTKLVIKTSPDTEQIIKMRPDTGQIIKMSELQSYPLLSTSGLMGEARRFLREAGGEQTDQASWWPHAQSVMALWLRLATETVLGWHGAYSISPKELDPQTEEGWEAMARRLAELVVEKARELEAGGFAEQAIYSEERGYRWEPWKPTALLQEFGLEGLDIQGGVASYER
jgi:hypothetical protein